MDPARLYNLADAALEAIGDYYDAAGVDLDLPAARLVSSTQAPPWDCELCAVTVANVGAHAGDPSQQVTPILEADPAYWLRFAQLTVLILRDVPVSVDGEVTDDIRRGEDLTARKVLADMGMVWNALAAAQDAGNLPCCGAIAFVGWAQVISDGGLAGSVTTVQVSLE